MLGAQRPYRLWLVEVAVAALRATRLPRGDRDRHPSHGATLCTADACSVAALRTLSARDRAPHVHAAPAWQLDAPGQLSMIRKLDPV
ncbi:MAG: hypothetical protein E6J90_16265 [Deltaproteobacteria bacterium]|nr:MAG: hypothetical protein E6J91_39540 [Deltaproteobacteria bacterium]TMQ20375.1 MAG: hypothetical protein E6J90_16265 [Deltaproteobacteria bacterium]